MSTRSGKARTVSVLSDAGPWLAIYGAVFDGTTGDELKVQAFLSPDAVTDPCGSLFGDNAEAPSSLDFVKVVTSGDTAGSYGIGADAIGDGGSAEVTLRSVRDGKTALHLPARKGAVVITAPQWSGGSSIDVELRAEFPKNPNVELECWSSASVTASPPVESSQCLCRKPDGTEFICDKASPDDDSCCDLTELDGERIPFSRVVSASYCPDLCSATPGNDYLCWELRSR